MQICEAEYLVDYGTGAPAGWEPSDEEILRVAERCGFE
jgi:hypothetical protein